MIGHRHLRCRAALHQFINIRQSLTTYKSQFRSYSVQELETSKVGDEQQKKENSYTIGSPDPSNRLDIKELLSKPTWSVRSLLPSSTEDANNACNTSSPSPTTNLSTEDRPSPQSATSDTKITPSQLQHLLRLSALPQPCSPSEEASMLSTLHQQLHFVRAIQSIDTTGVEPLVTIRDETEEGIRERTIGLDNEAIKEALAMETKVGRWGRVRRIRNKEKAGGEKKQVMPDRRYLEEQGWDPLKAAEGRTQGRYFVVDGAKKGPVARMQEAEEVQGEIGAAAEMNLSHETLADYSLEDANEKETDAK